MRSWAPLVLVAVVLSLLVAPSAIVDGAEETPYHIEGYVAEGGGSGKIPMQDVSVTILDVNGNSFEGRTDAKGFFSVVVNENTGLQIRFTTFGYSLIACPNTSAQKDTDFLALNLTAELYNAATRTYTVTSSLDGMQCAIMAATNGTVRGTVTYTNGSISGATVHFDPVGGGSGFTAGTDARGNFEIVCPTGAYNITASSIGFDDSDSTTVNVTSNPSTINIVMTKSHVREYFGLDPAHLLMFTGVCLGILLATVAWLLSRRMNGPNRVEIIDDSDFDDEEEIRRSG
ncbi:MAG: carboxypeptidase-like regulatory domain-containing protein [Candidatus Methanoplasma sp.]|jgi:hypothetical protein|nr:carboxypeptidase-like regulatory domain-containing protein [Candidatus Methanoplasma sp.]